MLSQIALLITVLALQAPMALQDCIEEALGRHPDLRVLMEPFQEKFPEWFPGHPNYQERIVDAESLDAQLAHIFSTYDGIKVVNYPLDPELYDHMLADERWRIVFVRRRNMLKGSISAAISHRTGVWEKRNLPPDPERLYEALDTIPVSEIVDWIDGVSGDMEEFEATLDSRTPGTVKKVTFDLSGEAIKNAEVEIRHTMSKQ